MTIYQNTKKKDNYRKLWEQYHGPIPKDLDGRTFDIHHIDGNRNNNSIENLIAVSIQEHYDIHESQGDWRACVQIARRMKKSPELISELARKAALKLVDEGRHPWSNKEAAKRNAIRRVDEGTHPWINKEAAKRNAIRRVDEGTHHLLKINGGSEFNRKNAIRRVDEGTHNLVGVVTCRDRQGNVVQVPKDIYQKQKEVTKDMTQWEFTTVGSVESRKRKLGLSP